MFVSKFVRSAAWMVVVFGVLSLLTVAGWAQDTMTPSAPPAASSGSQSTMPQTAACRRRR